MIGKDFLYWLETNGYGTKGVDIFHNFQPLKPIDCITVYDITAPTIEESSSLSVDQEAIQINVRNVDQDICNEIIEDIHLNFIGFGGEPLKKGSNKIVTMVFVDTGPHSIGKNEDSFNQWVSSYLMRVQTDNNKYRL